MWWFTQGLCSLPSFLVVWSSATFIVCYAIAVCRRDVDVVFPYISDTGAYPPESCIFGIMTFISACAGIGTIYGRYKFVEKLRQDMGRTGTGLNKTALVLGMLSCLSMCIVATFQETAVVAVHDTGALIFFISGVLYTIVQSLLSYQDSPYASSFNMFPTRVFISTIATLALFPTVICAFYVKQQTENLHRDRSSPDYPYHLASAVCEWVVAFSFICYFLTYIHEFKFFTLQVQTELVT